MHEWDRGQSLAHYQVYRFARTWREDGCQVHFLFGTREYVPADILLVHVDLSVVPDDYLEVARRYPIALNGRVKDIRKSALSQHLVRLGDDYPGPVIVKTDLNFMGASETLRLENRMPESTGWDYRIFPSIHLVPDALLNDPRWVVEKFLPEMEDNRYCVRFYQFLGDQYSCIRMLAPHPVIKARRDLASERVEPDRTIVQLRHQLGFDYGKFDYVLHRGQAILIDANKTPGQANLPLTPAREARLSRRARGIYSFLR